ncbi:MAG: YdcF family protein [Planctomycetaceae bacterium]
MPPLWAQRWGWSCLAAIVPLSLAGVIVVASGLAEGMLAAQRVMVHLVMPIGLAWLVSLFAAGRFFAAGNRRGGAVALCVFAAISVLFSPIANRRWIRQIEALPPQVSPLDPTSPRLAAVVVLGGGASLGRDGRPQLNSDGHRIVMAAQLWHADKVSAILCTGEDNFIAGAGDQSLAADGQKADLWNPARQAVDILVSLGVPQERLYRIGGTHTRAEMQQLHRFLDHPPESFPDGPVGLITSAFHMPRAIRLAQGEGLKLVPIPVAYRTGPAEPISPSDLVPIVEAGSQFYMVVREWLARLVGR